MFFVALGFEGLIDLGVLLCFLFLIALAYAYTQTLGLALQQLAKLFSSLNISAWGFSIGLGFIGDYFIDVDNAIRAALGVGIEATEYAWHKMCQYTASTIAGIGEASAWLANETLREFQKLWSHSIPALIKATVKPITHELANVGHTVVNTYHTATKDITQVIRVTKVYPRTIEIEVPKLAKAVTQTVKTAAAVAGAITLPKLRPIEVDISNINKRLAKLANVAGIGTLAGLGAFALAKLGLTEAQCSNAKRWNKGMCGTNINVLEDLLLGLTAIFGTLSLVKLAEEYQALIGDVSSSVQHFWRADVKGPGSDRALGQTGL